MRYTDLLTLAGGSAERAHRLARTALLPYIRDGRDPQMVRANLRDGMTFRDGARPGVLAGAWAALLDVPRRLLKRWATRAIRSAGLPRSALLRGPALAMHRGGVMTPSLRRFRP